jgi:predicted  nucleic acid-binding Zn-ribbon protein
MKYKCNHCGKIVERRSTKKWVLSYCAKTGKNVHLVLVSRKKKK